MRFLKNKILRAQAALNIQNAKLASTPESTHSKSQIRASVEEITFSDSDNSQKNGSPTTDRKTSRRVLTLSTSHVELSTQIYDDCLKNIAVNYGKTIASFAASPLALPYLEAILTTQGKGTLTVSQFQQYALRQKARIGGISSLRSALMIEDGDNEEAAACKRVFQAIGEIFIKYFSVNWIMTGRLKQKLAYLKYRCKMLRRIREPESFTYIKERSPTAVGKRRRL